MGKRLLFTFLICAILLAIVHLFAGVREERARSEYKPQGKMVSVEGVDIHVEVFGDGPDLVLLHGASGSTRDYTFELADKLAENYRVIVFDRPGLGWSDRPEGYGGAWNSAGESPAIQASLLKSAADQLDVKTPIVMGHSFGGSVALAWALDYPDTAALVLVSAVSHPWPGELGWTYTVTSSPAGGALFVPLVTAFAPKSYIEGVLETIFEPQQPPEGYLDHIGTAPILRRETMRANARQVNGLYPHIVEQSKRYNELTLPIEVLHGDADTIVPMAIHSEPLATTVASATLTVLPGIGHMPQHVAQDDVIAAIDRAASQAGLR